MSAGTVQGAAVKESSISKVLIANRGEIAVRIARTLRTLSLPYVVAFHAADRGGLAVREADETVEIAGETPVAAYLDGAQMIRACAGSGADAIHPGYGFLSENADFADQVAEAGLTFIGPGPEVIRLMGDKLASRDFVGEHGFPIAPSVDNADDPKAFEAAARKIGFPLLVKASAGGGGKGMHIVHEAGDLAASIKTAKSEAERYFGDGRVYCERYVERPRHIEVQVLADRHGNCIHLWERECSVQRRFQKIVEESPSPALTADLREEICAAAVGIAKAAGYANAGTVEFLLAPDGAFYFLEMNTRLQVEHPVTELVTGIDLVAEQIRIANGEPLSLTQDDVPQLGHAIEARVYAEDPAAGFAPATGDILKLVVPQGPGVRFDGGVVEGQAVTADFDPMLAKLIVHGRDRNQAIARARVALQQLVILGLTTNVAFLDRLLGHAAFAAGEVHTGSLEEWGADITDVRPDDDLLPVILAAASMNNRSFRQMADMLPEPYASIGPWRN